MALWSQPVLFIGYYYLLVLLLSSPVVLVSKRSQGGSDHLPLKSI